ncbi:MAG TPA: LysM peptidoglycan-binding domain-containing protein [Candidatus Marinimicrobia bacterium]|nr:LysM peptidoglycan-binding domain-containing protein [Candidatus Neomarinimicrobiota bacterium]
MSKSHILLTKISRKKTMPHTSSFLKIAMFAMFIFISCGKQTAPNIDIESKQTLSIPNTDSNTNRMQLESNLTSLTIKNTKTADSINQPVNVKKSNTVPVQELTTNLITSDESTELESISDPLMNSANNDAIILPEVKIIPVETESEKTIDVDSMLLVESTPKLQSDPDSNTDAVENIPDETTETEFSASSNVSSEYGWEEYMIKPGDFLIKIAKNEYGDWKRWRDIYDWNRKEIGDNPNLIYPYHFLDMNKPMDQVEKSEPVFNEYIIQKGDNLWTIAGKTYGDEKSWIVIYWDNEEIIDANEGILYTGMILQLRTKLDPRP